MSPELGAKVIAIAQGLVGSHYINGGYGATPGRSDGCPCRPGGIALIADEKHLGPRVQGDEQGGQSRGQGRDDDDQDLLRLRRKLRQPLGQWSRDDAGRARPCRVSRLAERHAAVELAELLPAHSRRAARSGRARTGATGTDGWSGARRAPASATSTVSASSAIATGRPAARSYSSTSAPGARRPADGRSSIWAPANDQPASKTATSSSRPTTTSPMSAATGQSSRRRTRILACARRRDFRSASREHGRIWCA